MIGGGPGPGGHVDGGHRHVGVDRVFEEPVDDPAGPLDHRSIAADGAEGAKEEAPQPPGQIVLALARIPTEAACGRGQHVPHHGLEGFHRCGGNDAVQTVEGAGEQTPQGRLRLVPVAEGEIEEGSGVHSPRLDEGPGVVEKRVALEGIEGAQSGEEAVEQLRRVPHPVEASASCVADGPVDRAAGFDDLRLGSDDRGVGDGAGIGRQPHHEGNPP